MSIQVRLLINKLEALPCFLSLVHFRMMFLRIWLMVILYTCRTPEVTSWNNKTTEHFSVTSHCHV